MSEWGPWIEHDGKGCPCVGAWVLAQGLAKPGGDLIEHEFLAKDFAEWYWAFFGAIGFGDAGKPRICGKIIRYRIRKPRGLTILENLIADLPAPVGPKVDA